MPEDWGSTSVNIICMAIAASMAPPPRRRISSPALAASGLAAATMCRRATATSRTRKTEPAASSAAEVFVGGPPGPQAATIPTATKLKSRRQFRKVLLQEEPPCVIRSYRPPGNTIPGPSAPKVDFWF